MSDELRAQVDQVKQALASIETCSTSTLTSLANLFAPKPETSPPDGKGKPYIRSTKSSTVSVKAGSRTRTKLQAQINVCEAEIGRAAVLSPPEKVVLATEVINVTLKVLTGAVKRPQQNLPRQKKDADKCTQSTSGNRRRRSESEPKRPLQPRSLNRVSSSPTQSTPLRRSSSGLSKTPPGLLALAQCARRAFSYLRSPEATKNGSSQLPKYQLESGMSALAGKLVALGLDDLAIKELQILKSRLYALFSTGEACGKTSCQEKRQPSFEKTNSRIERVTLASLLKFENVAGDERGLELVIATQIQTLKLIVSKKQAGSVEAILETLRLSSPNSPVSLIAKSVSDASASNRAVQQLQTISQLLFSLCPMTWRGSEDVEFDRRVAILPETVLQLQQLALKIRLLWWKHSGHHGDVDQDIVGPFSRCLQVFSKQSSLDPQGIYDLASSEHLDFMAYVDSCGKISIPLTKVQGTRCVEIYILLGALSRDAALFEDAVRWTKAAQDLVKGKDKSDASRCAISTRLAALVLRCVPPKSWDDSATQTLQQAADELGGNIRGSSTELEWLLNELSILRRSTLSFLSDHNQNGAPVQVDVPRPLLNVSAVCRSLIFTSVRVFSRYLGSPPSRDTEAKAFARYRQRIDKLQSSALRAIDSALYHLKTAIGTDELDWEQFDTTLQHCMLLASVLDDPHNDNEHCRQKEALRDAVAAKASNLYWVYYLSSEKPTNGRCRPYSQHCLQRSIESAREASASGLSTLLAIKLERLSIICMSRGAIQDGRNALVECIQTQIKDGILQEASIQASGASWQKLLDRGGNSSIFGRTLTTFLKVARKTSLGKTSPELFFDDLSLGTVERGCLLEWQLLALSRIISSTARPESYLATLTTLTDALLKIFSYSEYPLRRTKLLMTLLRLSSEDDLILAAEFQSMITEEARLLLAAGVRASTKEDSFPTYEVYLRVALKLSLSLRGETPNIDEIKNCLARWAQIVRSADSLEILEQQIDDVSAFLDQLSAVADFLAMKGLCHITVPTLGLITRVQELQNLPDNSDLVAKLSKLGLQYLNLGYSGKAGLTLNKARHIVRQPSCSVQVAVGWHLAYAEYHVVLGNTERCVEHLAQVKVLAEGDSSIRRSYGQSASLLDRTEINRLTADAFYVSSQAAFGKGLLTEAVDLAKKCVKLNYRLWADLEGHRCRRKWKSQVEASDIETDTLMEATSSLAALRIQAPVVMSTTHESLKGAAFWCIVPSLYRGLNHLSRLYSHFGMFQEATYYAEQARKIVEAVNAGPLIADSLAHAADLQVRGGQMEKARDTLSAGATIISENEKCRALILLHCLQGSLQISYGNLDSANTEFVKAGSMLEAITNPVFIHNLDEFGSLQDGLESRLATLSLEPSSAAKSTTVVRHPRMASSKADKNNATNKGKVTTIAPSTASSECFELVGLRGNILHLRAYVNVLQRNSEAASLLISQAENYSMNRQSTVLHRVAWSKHLLRESLEEMSADAVFCVLEDSTISFPSTITLAKKPQAASSNLSPGRGVLASLEKSPKGYSRNLGKARKTGQPKFIDVLGDARESLSDVLPIAAKLCSTSTVRTISSVLSNATILLAAATPGRARTLVRPTSMTYYANIARSLAIHREMEATRIEKQTYTRDQLLTWPGPGEIARSQLKADDLYLDPSQFQKHYIDIIPSHWSVILIALSENSEELFISKLQAGQSPFVLRLPLSRHNSRDADEEIFDFKQGQAELLEIVDLANFTAHDARDMTRKGAKSRWWAEREALDTRLKDLLVNIENIWLGGFRGLFSQSPYRSELLSRFQQSFQNILDEYLPSRLKSTKKRKLDRVTLAPHILGLFVGLGNPSESAELDEPLMDLLYFVVDILQFHGEHNAYDEIDFDSIVVETKDALRYYYDAIQTEPAEDSRSHTVLILDKGLHAFPWESLPCLNGLSVSRLSSLECLRERILRQQSMSPTDDCDGLRVARGNGTYVLNPLGDLKSTQKAFEGQLRSLEGWNSIVQREPTETEMKTGLESHDLFLYFGHGSGSQYIKGRTIRKLDRCAVTFLMGCSSGSLSEAGEFEPYGTPINYIHAGCPALVATLWDVTDKDIDRFSKTVFHSWGLLPPDPSVSSGSDPQAKAKAKGRPTRKRDPSPTTSNSSSMSLTKAVAQARQACVLKYLNGAAPIVYGIPVYVA